MDKLRKPFSLVVAIILYFFIHEGAHFVFALITGTFQKVNISFFGLGMQIVANIQEMTVTELFIFGILGAIFTLTAGYLLTWKREQILRSKSKLLCAVTYYTTFVLLINDPLYLSVLFRFVGGGDMNSIVVYGIPENLAALFFFLLLLFNGFLFFKKVYPSYRNRFQGDFKSEHKAIV